MEVFRSGREWDFFSRLLLRQHSEVSSGVGFVLCFECGFRLVNAEIFSNYCFLCTSLVVIYLMSYMNNGIYPMEV